LEQFHDHVKTIQKITTSVCNGAEDSEINKQQCKRLANMYKEINAFVKQLEVMAEFHAVHPTLSSLLASVEELIFLLKKGEVLVLQYAEAQWFDFLVTREKTKRLLKRFIYYSRLTSQHYARIFLHHHKFQLKLCTCQVILILRRMQFRIVSRC